MLYAQNISSTVQAIPITLQDILRSLPIFLESITSEKQSRKKMQKVVK